MANKIYGRKKHKERSTIQQGGKEQKNCMGEMNNEAGMNV